MGTRRRSRRAWRKNEDLNTTGLFQGGARIHLALQDIFVKGLEA